MRKIFLPLLLSACLCLPAIAGSKRHPEATRLTALLQEMQMREEVTPDEFYNDVNTLRKAIQDATDPAAKAIYQAALAHLVSINAFRAQAEYLNTPCHPDSIKEWSRREYRNYAAQLYRDALSRPSLLHTQTTAAWKPVPRQGKDEKVYASDMLYVVWTAMQQDIPEDVRKENKIPGWADMTAYYRSCRLDEAAMWLAIDSMEARLIQGTPNEERVRWTQIRNDYAHLQACAEIYLRLSRLPDITPEEKRSILMEGLEKYPKYARRNSLRNALLDLERPTLSWEYRSSYAPHTEVEWKMNIQNMRSLAFTLYALPNDFSERQQEDLVKAVRREGKKTNAFVHRTRCGQPGFDAYKSFTDTVRWTTPGYGLYAMVVEGKSGARLSSKADKSVCLFRVSSLALLSQSMPGNKMRLVAVDATTGEPRSNVNVELSRVRDRDTTTLRTFVTNDRGYVETDMPDSERQTTYARMWQGADSASIAAPLYFYWQTRTTGITQSTVRTYTDRSIYRPGQQVHVAALALQTTTDGSRVEAGKKLQLTYHDANRQELATHEVTTDSLGMATDSLQLPDHVLPGSFSVRVKGEGGSCSFRVEEYKRATFYVNIDKPRPTEWPARDVALSGQACTYSGVPLADARVTVRYRWNDGWGYRSVRGDEEKWEEADTVQTDNQGRFALKVPVSLKEDTPNAMSHLQAEVDVLSRQGETCTASHGLTLHHTGLRMNFQTASVQEKSRLKPWNIQLLDCVGQPVAGKVRCKLLAKDGHEVFATTVDAGQPTLPEGLQEVPTGNYTLHAWAQVKQDTASVRLPYALFTFDSSTPLPDMPLHLYAPEQTFTESRHATVRVSSSLKDAYVFFTVLGEDRLVVDELMHLQNKAVIHHIPYDVHRGEVLKVVCHLMSGGRLYSREVTLRKERPEQKLTLRWDTFRDKLEPGAQEEWRMTLCKPDGTPARANVMCTLYDAALDAIQPHHFGLNIPQYLGTPMMCVRAYSFHPRYENLAYAMKQYPDQTPRWSRLNEELFYRYQNYAGFTGGYQRGSTRTMRLGHEAPVMMFKEAVVGSAQATASTANGMMMDEAVAEEAAMEADDGGMAGMPEGMVRTGLHELAFFKPVLRTDANGQVALAFTLPEGLTSWHLMGLAHTADLYSTTFEDTITASKRIMAQLQLPRFLRSGDQAVLTAYVANRTAEPVKGHGTLQICDAGSRKVLHTVRTGLQLEGGQDTVFHFPYQATADHPNLTIRWTAQTPVAGDGEQRALPVLSDVQEVTETKSFLITGAQHWQMDLKKLFAYDHPEATDRRLTLEYTARPVWMAIRALPTLCRPEANDVLSLSAAYYADAMAHYTMRAIPQLAEAVERWSKDSSQSGGTLRANEELTGMETDQTPWLKDAERDSLQRQALSELYRTASQPQTRLAAIEAIARLQRPDGAFAWYPGMYGSAYLTAEVVRMLTRLHLLAGADPDGKVNDREQQVYTYAMEYLSRHVADLQRQSDAKSKIAEAHSSVVMQYLYALSRGGWQPDDAGKKVARKWVDALKETAASLPYEQRAMAAIVLHLQGEKQAARKIADKLHTLVRQADGFHLAYPGGMGVSIDRKIQQHVALMEAFDLIMPKDTALIQGMEEWLVMQKRTQAWEQPMQTADAVYMIVQHHAVPFSETTEDRLTVRGSKGSQPVTGSTDYPGYLRTTIDITQPRALEVDKRSQGTSWGAVYAQYSIPYSSLQSQREGISVRRDVAQSGWQEGDRVHIRYTLTVDHDMEYVALHAGRIAAAQPTEQTSGYRIVSGIGCYRAVHDTGNSYYFDALPRGTYVIEEDWTLDRPGTYQLGAARVQCMYAPEFQAHTAGESITVAGYQK